MSEDEKQAVQITLIDELQAVFEEVKRLYDGDFDAAVDAAERKLGVLREARKYAGVKTEKKPRRAPRKRKGTTTESTTETE